MPIELAAIAGMLGVGVSFMALLSPIVRLHSRVDLLSYQISEQKKQLERLSERLIEMLDIQKRSGL